MAEPMTKSALKFDEFDKKIVDVLREKGRLSNIEVAQQVGLSHSSCSRRIARLERDGLIVGYRALTDRRRLGLSVRAFCGVIRDPGVGWEELARQVFAVVNRERQEPPSTKTIIRYAKEKFNVKK